MERAASLTSARSRFDYCTIRGVACPSQYPAAQLKDDGARDAFGAAHVSTVARFPQVSDGRSPISYVYTVSRRREGNDFLIEWREMMRRLMLGCSRTKAAPRSKNAR
jgi:hypothetical protein